MVGAVTRVLWAGIFPAAPAVLDALEATVNVNLVEENAALGLFWFRPRGRLRSVHIMFNLSDINFPPKSLNKNPKAQTAPKS